MPNIKSTNKTIAENRKARHDYYCEEALEVGIVLVGTEVKSIRNGNVNLKESYADIYKGELFVRGMHISPYEKGNIHNMDPLRFRKLLLHKKELRRISDFKNQKGYTLIPLSLYLKNGLVKMQLGICRGKTNYDKRDSLLEKDAKRNIERAIKEKYK